MHRSTALIALLVPLLLVNACQRKEEVKPPERITQITVDAAKTRDLPLVESATGRETALGFSLDYDPTRVARGNYHVRLTFPEQVANQLRIGQNVRLTSFGNDAKAISGEVTDIRPALNTTTLSREVIVVVRNAAGWRPSGSIKGEVTLGVHKNAVVVPEQAVVLRPAGTVVYVIDNNVARERAVKTGIARDGVIEILEGVAANAVVAVDGASLLSDGAKVAARDAAVRTEKAP